MAESSKSPLIGIVVAVIGLFGSIAVAFITTQAKFSHELQGKEVEVAKLKHDLERTEQRLLEKHKELDAKVAAVDDRLRKLDAQIDVATTVADKLATYGGRMFRIIGGDK